MKMAMFVEVIRLLIVFLATGGGFALGEGAADEPGTGAILGATLGACSGYVAGGVVGRLLRRAMGVAERRLEEISAARLFAGGVGAVVFGGLAAVVALPAGFLLPGPVTWPVVGILVWTGAFQGFSLAAKRSDELLAMAGLSTRPLVRATPYGPSPEQGAVLVDTSAVIDGRLLALVRAGFLREALLVPRFVLDEVQAVADAQDPVRRRRGRRGLEVLDAVNRAPDVEVHVLDDEVPEHEAVDAKLVALARRLKAPLLTVDGPLQKVAELQGVRCLSPARLADDLRPVHIAGEVVRVTISKGGREPGQGVAYLDDGTMVVVSEAEPLVGHDVDVRITSNVQTSIGRMLFASLAPEGDRL